MIKRLGGTKSHFRLFAILRKHIKSTNPRATSTKNRPSWSEASGSCTVSPNPIPVSHTCSPSFYPPKYCNLRPNQPHGYCKSLLTMLAVGPSMSGFPVLSINSTDLFTSLAPTNLTIKPTCPMAQAVDPPQAQHLIRDPMLGQIIVLCRLEECGFFVWLMSEVIPLDSGPVRKMLVMSDSLDIGNLKSLNDLAKQARADHIIHTGDFGFYDDSSLDRIADKYVAARHPLSFLVVEIAKPALGP